MAGMKPRKRARRRRPPTPDGESRRRLRHFAWAVALLLAVIAWRQERQAALPLQIAAALVFSVGTVLPRTMRWPYLAVRAATFPVRWLAQRVGLALVYFGLLTPLAWCFRLGGRDALKVGPDAGADTDWQPRPEAKDPGRHFRPF